MTNTVEQVTNLLRNVQQRSAREHPSQTRNIKGGSKKKLIDSKDARDVNEDHKHLISIDQHLDSEDGNRTTEMIL